MKTVLILVVGVLVGCSSPRVVEGPIYTTQNLVMDRNIQPLTRGEQIDAIKDCQEVGL
jgi:uncharacterized protein YcfL